MESKNWKTVALFYGLVIVLLLGGLVFVTNRPLPVIQETNEPSSSLRIVSLAPNLTEILYALGLNDQIVAVSSDSNYPSGVETKKKVGSFWNPDLEAVLSARPTLVLTLGFQQQTNLAAHLETIGCPAVSLTIENIDQMYAAIEKIGSLTDRQDQAKQLIDQISGRLNEIRAKAAEYEGVRVMWVVQRQPIRAAGKNTFINEMLEIVGAENVIKTTIYQYPPIEEEQIIAAAPEVIIETADSAEDLQRMQATAGDYYARFETVPAVQHNRIFVVDGDLVCRLGPRLPQGAERVLDCIRQERSNQGQNYADY